MNGARTDLRLLSLLDNRCDPRQGLAHTASQLIESTREAVGARAVALVLGNTLGPQAWVGSIGEALITLSPEARRKVGTLLNNLPDSMVTHERPRAFGWLGGTRLACGKRRTSIALSPLTTARMARLGQLLAARSLVVVPLVRAGLGLGHLIVGLDRLTVRPRERAALASAATEVRRLIETAALVDQLQQDSHAQSRARLGRDLHDSAIQPYLGLKYAVEGLALRARPDNVLHGDLTRLARQVGSEVESLRQLIHGMRHGDMPDSDTIGPAVQRQAQHFAQLFDIDVRVDCPEHLPISRQQRGALFHMVNEALNNVRKHTPARHVGLTLTAAASVISLQVSDDAGSILGRPVPDFHPASLGERVNELGGHLALKRPDGMNTELLITIPV